MVPFIGKRAGTGERVDILRVERPREVFAFGEVLCPLCEERLVVKDGLVRVQHFAHRARCASPLAAPKSVEHLLEQDEQWSTGKRYFDMTDYWQWREAGHDAQEGRAIACNFSDVAWTGSKKQAL